MPITLPPPLDRYVAAQNAHDTDCLVACFAADARVRDEGRDIVGADAIRAWKDETSARYRVTLEPLRIEPEAGGPALTARVSGTFPGSPVDLTFHFTLAGGLIQALEVTL